MAVSDTLRDHLIQKKNACHVLTHGIDLAHWGYHESQSNHMRPDISTWLRGWANIKRPILLFWGVVDQRLDLQWCRALADQCGSLVLVGPHQSPDPQLKTIPNIHLPGPVPYSKLPLLAMDSDILVMPYADLPVTRAMQPLKFKEYLATGKPVVVRKLPATIGWSDAADVVSEIDQLIGITQERIAHGIPLDQEHARRRLCEESWMAKANVFEGILLNSGEKDSNPLFPMGDNHFTSA